MWTRSRKIGLVVIVGTIVVGVGGAPLYDYFWGEEHWCDTNYRVDSPCVGSVPAVDSTNGRCIAIPTAH